MTYADTPVALIFFNRPDHLRRVFEALSVAKPKELFLIADGARHPQDEALCKAARDVVENIPWDCEVHRLYSDTNLGCRNRVVSGINAVFEQVERAIILEDDCVPQPSFFQFCQEMLERYQDDPRVGMITGQNLQPKNQASYPFSYYFSRLSHIWGWATWRRAWQTVDPDIPQWGELRDSAWLADLLHDERVVADWTKKFDSVFNHEVDTWDFQWTFNCWYHNSLCVVPRINLVSNIGFDETATHTRKYNKRLADQRTQALEFPLRHPPMVEVNTSADEKALKFLYPAPKSPMQALLLDIGKRARRVLP